MSLVKLSYKVTSQAEYNSIQMYILYLHTYRYAHVDMFAIYVICLSHPIERYLYDVERVQ
jgi:hypothetical protein